ncbi:MAG: hypothetical protein A3D31_00850 [Candidatus Fluviicola riflensis]|nr:MAG: hypothetical protein CHH17_04690 [Candidatus Fluviicola riflensis]OGS76155.1 MAG: hypothetical protein A3D31_00850 [Candidatus Fluviicola riflensis]OGS83301.1 MAG: hypothetical protein A2724_00990 [Fluviicola sp. RIFCSPHIGHO2_01_FULL_43_53]OGS83687.1 MAG: hypothetical protein A3E30_17455 [Fluviicola sp. RIFCSPHIGHO2_12_FULL_43_24]
MKIIVTIGVCLFTLGAFAQQEAKPATPPATPPAVAPAKKAPKPTKPAVEFKTMTIERADIPYDSQEQFVFEFKNNGSTPVIITNVQTSCGCTKAEQPTEPVAKKKTGKIAVKYDTKRVGNFTKTITVTTNVSTEPIILTIKGNVLAADPNATPPTGTPAKTEGHEGHNH